MSLQNSSLGCAASTALRSRRQQACLTLAEGHGITQLALEDQAPEALVERLFLRILTRPPRAEERAAFVAYLREGYAGRVQEPPQKSRAEKRRPPRYVSWSNHLTPEANEIKVQLEAAARRGDP
ncbi:hypothetical protein, partial [Nitrospira sp. BLG_2]|uniref:hypothetical protein n=1 Tax=Nitrospira sp. BLG_2 TaxID=3397507 RepID=UPI003B9C2C94